MNRKIAAFWNKYEAWVAPLAMALFLWAGLVIGLRWGASEQAAISADTISKLNEVIVAKDDRLRKLQGDTVEAKDTAIAAKDETIKVTKDAASQAAEVAKAAAEAAKVTAELKLKGAE